MVRNLRANPVLGGQLITLDQLLKDINKITKGDYDGKFVEISIVSSDEGDHLLLDTKTGIETCKKCGAGHGCMKRLGSIRIG